MDLEYCKEFGAHIFCSQKGVEMQESLVMCVGCLPSEPQCSQKHWVQIERNTVKVAGGMELLGMMEFQTKLEACNIPRYKMRYCTSSLCWVSITKLQ